MHGLLAAGWDASCVYFERDYFEGCPLPVESASLGHIQHGRYFMRMWHLLRALPTVRRHACAADVLYAFGLDMALLAVLARGWKYRIPLVYEVGDVFQYMRRTSLSRAARLLERMVLRLISLVVPVTRGFAEEYYIPTQRVSPSRILVLENKVPAGVADNEIRQQVPSTQPVLTIGRFGMIRDRISWEILKEIVRQGGGRVRVRLHGFFMGLDGYEEDLAAIPELDYRGPYKNPDDLVDVYDGIDISWVADSSSGGPEARWTRSNRFYEACAFARPMLVYSHQADGFAADEHGLGLLLDMSRPTECVRSVLSITDADLVDWHRNMLSLPREVYELTNDHEVLSERLCALVKCSHASQESE